MNKMRIEKEQAGARPNDGGIPGGKEADAARVLAKAACEAANQLGLTDQELADAIHLELEEVVLIRDGDMGVSPDTESGRRFLMLIRAYRSLVEVVGHDPAMQRLWLRSRNHGVDGIPVEMLMGSDRLSILVDYLEERSQGI